MCQEPPTEQVRAAEIAKGAISLAKKFVAAGGDGLRLDREIETFILDEGGRPSLKGYQPTFALKPYEWSICLGVNEDAVHGVPAKYLGPAQLVTVDLVVEFDGWHADMARTFHLGEDKTKREFAEHSFEIFKASLDVIQPQQPLAIFGGMVQNAAHLYGYGVVKEYCGHGIGRYIHTPPQILNYPAPSRDVFQVGQAYAVEPILAIQKTYSLRHYPNDGFSVRANCLVSHNEDTIFVSKNGITNLTGNES